ncbi:hypothetical protein OTK49_01520 [Vibrio coralliirubri]|uniref:hypothetical protein n=1 Tax=Vibrio coralliirubri TaxID=1516159 RepID=UPI002283467F|nr:hypothetical protein [Vibrio coralliirubri]MCY9861204.1 hypothetical protein [Vibrio coralliirubri]
MKIEIDDTLGCQRSATFGTRIKDSVSGTEGIIVSFNEHMAGCLYIDISYQVKASNGNTDYLSRSLSSHDAIYLDEGTPRLREIYESNNTGLKLRLGNRVRQISTGVEGYVGIICHSYTGEIDYQVIREFADRGDPMNGGFFVSRHEAEYVDDGVTDKVVSQILLRSKGLLSLNLNDKVTHIVTGATGTVIEVAQLNGGTILGTVVTKSTIKNKRPFEFTTDIELLEHI